jgi:hypothetical protein
LLKTSLDNENLNDLFYCDVIRTQASALEARVKELEEQVRWIPVRERLPKRGWNWIVADGVVQRVAYRYQPFMDSWEPDIYDADWVLDSIVSHWMPLPNPPAKEAEND